MSNEQNQNHHRRIPMRTLQTPMDTQKQRNTHHLPKMQKPILEQTEKEVIPTVLQ